MIYVVMEGKIIDFPDAVVGKLSRDGGIVHLIDKDGVISGNIPMKHVRFWGDKLPPIWQKQYGKQLAWEALSAEEQEKLKAEHLEKRKEGS